MGNFHWTEILVIVILFIVLFGAKKIPEIARSIGKSVHEFKKGLKEGSAEAENQDQNKQFFQNENTPKS